LWENIRVDAYAYVCAYVRTLESSRFPSSQRNIVAEWRFLILTSPGRIPLFSEVLRSRTGDSVNLHTLHKHRSHSRLHFINVARLRRTKKNNAYTLKQGEYRTRRYPLPSFLSLRSTPLILLLVARRCTCTPRFDQLIVRARAPMCQKIVFFFSILNTYTIYNKCIFINIQVFSLLRNYRKM